MNEIEARRIALNFLRGREAVSGVKLALKDEATEEHGFGWIFFYNSKEFIETGSLSAALAGNSPIVVRRRDGMVLETGTAEPLSVYIGRLIDRGDL